jgi:hypothetical protein
MTTNRDALERAARIETLRRNIEQDAARLEAISMRVPERKGDDMPISALDVLINIAENEPRFVIPRNAAEAKQELIDLRVRLELLEAAIRWACGEEGDFKMRDIEDGPYWWRKELRRRASLANKGVTP